LISVFLAQLAGHKPTLTDHRYGVRASASRDVFVYMSQLSLVLIVSTDRGVARLSWPIPRWFTRRHVDPFKELIIGLSLTAGCMYGTWGPVHLSVRSVIRSLTIKLAITLRTLDETSLDCTHHRMQSCWCQTQLVMEVKLLYRVVQKT